MIKIALCEFRQESNSFNPEICSRPFFERGGIFGGDAILAAMKGRPCAMGGAIRAGEEAGAEMIPLYAMHSNSHGPVEHSVVEDFLTEVRSRLQTQVDCLYVSLHGATQTTREEDGAGYILEALRALVGPRVVITASCDLHANVTRRMQRNADYLCGYHTYPHVDQEQTGYRAMRLGILAWAEPENRPHMVRTTVPMIVPASGYTTLRGPFAELMRRAEAMVEDGQLLDASVFQMQPWLDVSEAGSAVLTISRDPETAKACARSLAQGLLALRESCRPQLYSMDAVIEKAAQNRSGKPVVLVDAADSSNAGACGDSPAVIARVLASGKAVKTAAYLNDPQAVKAIFRAGVGAELELNLGGSISSAYYSPLPVRVRVGSLHDGVFRQEGPAGRGMENHLGKTAVIRIGNNIDVVVCEGIRAPGDPQIFRHFGIEPKDYQLVVVKACTSFRAAYEPIALEICDTDTPGTAPVVLERLKFNRLPAYFYPFADLTGYTIPEPVEEGH